MSTEIKSRKERRAEQKAAREVLAHGKALWAVRLKKRHARGRRPEKMKTLREKRDPRVLKAYQTAAVDILDALFGTKRP